VPSTKTVRLALWAVGLGAAALQAWAFRRWVNPDAIAYLDIATRFAHGHWGALVNAYWSPMYPFLLGVAFRMVRPSPYWESTVAHGVKIGLQTLSPDLLLSAFFYLAAGVIARISTSRGKWSNYVVLGAMTGIGYLAKAILFPLAWVFLGCCFVVLGRPSRAFTRAAIAVFVFCVIAGPYVWALSHAKGRVTYGDVGKIAYAEFVDGIQRYVHWQGSPGVAGMPLHPTRLVLANPPVFAFAGLVQGTYPPWDDPSYWYDGVSPRFILHDQLRAVRYTIQEYAAMLPYMGVLLAAFLALLFFAEEPSMTVRNALKKWPIWVPAIVGLVLYGLLYVESRFVVPFFVVIWAALFAGVSTKERAEWPSFVRCWTLAFALTLGSGIIWLAGRATFRAFQPQPFTAWAAAEGLKAQGIRPGDRVALIGNALNCYWAHLAGVRIVAEIPLDGRSTFWAAARPVQARALEAFVGAGAKVVVSDERPPTASDPGWHELAGTEYYLYNLGGVRAGRQ